eukprot:Gb_03697 [translate_table: standard]
MEFRKENRSCQTPPGFRLATVEEATENLERIKTLLDKWDKVRLLDGWLSTGADGEIRGPKVGFRHGLGYMLVTRSALDISADGSAPWAEGYREVEVTEEGKQSALLLCAEDFNCEVVDWLLNFAWPNVNNNNANTQVQRDEREIVLPIKEFSEAVSRFVREFSNGNAQAGKTEEREQTMRGSVCQMIQKVLDGLNCHIMIEEHIDWTRNVVKKFESVAPLRGDTKSWDNDVLWNAITPILTHQVVVGTTRDFQAEGRKVEAHQVAMSVIFYVNRFIEETLLADIKVRKHIHDGAWKAFRSKMHFDESERYAMLGCDVRNYVLRQAATKGDARVVQKLLDCGADPLETDDEKKTALHHWFGKEGPMLDVAEYLLETCSNKEELLGASVAHGLTALHTASSNGYPLLCKILLHHGAELNAKDQSGQIPLHHAVREQNEEVVRVLINTEIFNSPVMSTSIVDYEYKEGNTPLDMAAAQNNLEIFRMLLLRSKRAETYFHKMDVGNLLLQSARKGYVDLLDKLLENGANLLDSDGDGKTALHYAADGDDDVLLHYMLRSYGRTEEQKIYLTKVVDKNGRTVLHAAASRGHEFLCFILLNIHSGLYMCKDRDGQTPLHYAVKQNKEDVVNTLLEESSEKDIHKVDLRDLSGMTPLHMAAAQGSLKLVKKLLSCLQDPQKYVRIGDFLGETALHKAARIGHIQIIRKLSESGSQPLQERDCDGKTAFHYAVQVKNRDDAVAIAELLLEKCKSNEEKILLLWTSAAGIGTAEESLRYIDMAQEFLTRGGDIADLLHTPDCKEKLSEEETKNVKKVVNQIKKRTEQASEQPTLSDDLGRNDYAMGLAALFLNPYLKSPITVGISGEWGMGKSSLMFQTEINLLKTTTQLAFPNLLEVHKKFPGAKKLNLTKEGKKKCHDIRRSLEVFLATEQESKAKFIRRVFAKITRWARQLFGTKDKTKAENTLFEFLESYKPKYHAVYKSLALVGSNNMIERNGGKLDSNNEGFIEAIVPAILTVRYNAWEYRNESEAWAGLAVQITKEMEETMTLAQWLSTCWRTHKRSIWVAVILPCLLAAILAGCITWLAWLLLERSKQKGLEELKYGSLAATVVVIVWTVVKSTMAILKPISTQIAGYISLPDHTEKLGYHQQVIKDINFLKEEIGKQPYWLCTIIAFLWCWIRLDWSLNNVGDTSFPKVQPQFKGNIRIIAVVDDLDRCQESVILQVLTAINLVLAVCKIDVIVGMDEKMIDRAIIKKYGDKSNNKLKKSNEELADKFFQKIIQLPLDLPDPSDIESKRFLEGQLGSLDGDFETEPFINSGGETSTSHQDVGRQGVEVPESLAPRPVGPEGMHRIRIVESEASDVGGQGVQEGEPSSAPGPAVVPKNEASEDWHQFEKGPSLREIVDHCIEEQRVEKVKSSKGDTILRKVRGKEKEKEMTIIEEKDMKVMEGGSSQCEEAKIKVLGKQKEGMSKDCEKCKRKISKVAYEEELEDWEKLSETLRRYNVSMEGMQAFQRFRFYCNSGYLPWPTPNMEIAYKHEYEYGRRPHHVV